MVRNNTQSKVLRGGEASGVKLGLLNGKRAVIKTSPVGGDLRNELIAHRLLLRHKVSVPEIFAYRGRKLYLEFIDNKEIKNPVDDKTLEKIVNVLVGVHRVKSNKIGELIKTKPYSDWTWKSFLRSELANRLRLIKRHKFANSSVVKEIYKKFNYKLKNLPNRPFIPSLVHGDFHLNNILLSKSGEIFIIDFDTAFYGDPLYDFAVFSNFHPTLFKKAMRFYIDKHILGNNWNHWFNLYRFCNAMNLAAFYARIGNKKEYLKFWSLANKLLI